MNDLHTIVDDNDVTWVWDGSRLYVPEADAEFVANGICPLENGEYLDTWQECLDFLKDEGYIEE